ncbi:hypothetical protein A2960_05455 [Candidatus Gottesmanbacteria bacterium RIFCSPLOWO2_01_FULL_39_12b]|uniref:5'-3' exonuclease domain-containing protein n=1 Tax=Candidatus Gottesmanbacteria bacterium RIFCSPLOWO2_01_FULL_39_12b TaxID=1798388 RepID=A0A1F6AM41_9BACT|nr:MAG: hypothetical protein A2960_05455 [Candidatus Gottesmanbacteria bacterium RIFCSPLOWO2_01_FULL_39_12b]
MNRLVLIDGHAILYRAYHALPTSLTTPKGQIINAVYGFTSMLLKVISELKPTHLIVVFDTPQPTFRNKLYKDYQIQRPKADEEFIVQIDLVKKVVNEMNIPLFECPGFEADDVIGTVVKQYRKENSETIVVTSDRDMLQLINGKVKLYMPVKGLSISKLYGEKEAEERMGVKSSQIVDYKGLVGDPSDNYPGIPGIGPKSAEKLLRVWGTLENIYAHLSSIDGKLAEKLLEHKDSALLSKQLATIVVNAPVTFNPEACILKNFDRPNVHNLFAEFGFRSLIPRLRSDNIQQKTFNKKINNNEKSQQIKFF